MGYGVENDAPDTFSCHPVHDPLATDALAELDIHDYPDMSIAEVRAISNQHNEIQIQIERAVCAPELVCRAS